MVSENSEVDLTDAIKAWPGQYIPHQPTDLQLGFCCLPSVDVLTGGAAGGGKSDALLMAALQYVEVPGYAAVIYRKAFSDLAKQGGIMDRARHWLEPHIQAKTVKFIPATHTYIFPSGAALEFGYIGKKGAGDSVQGTEYSFVGIDEVTQHTLDDAMWCRSRLRKPKGANFPLRFRCTANPGNIGHEWLKDYFSIIPNPKYDKDKGRIIQGHFFSDEPLFVGGNPKRPFIPARLIDNPYIDKNYVESLIHLDPLTRAQLLDGDWEASPSSRFKRTWFQERWTQRGDYINFKGESILLDSGPRFATVDIAASQRDGVAGEQFYSRGGSRGESGIPCWTVISTWTILNQHLVLLDVQRIQVEAPDILKVMESVHRKWKVSVFIAEGNGVGKPIIQFAQKNGLPAKEMWTTFDKIVNSYTAANMASQGRIVLPHEELGLSWLKPFESEVFNWMGFPEETSDQVDTLSVAAKEADFLFANRHRSTSQEMPQAVCGPQLFDQSILTREV